MFEESMWFQHIEEEIGPCDHLMAGAAYSPSLKTLAIHVPQLMDGHARELGRQIQDDYDAMAWAPVVAGVLDYLNGHKKPVNQIHAVLQRGPMMFVTKRAC